MARSTVLALALAAALPAAVQDVDEILEARCVECHEGAQPEAGIDLGAFDLSDLDTAVLILEQVRAREMPPREDAVPLEEEERQALIDALVEALEEAAAGGGSAGSSGAGRDPGRPTLRRLNRDEYGRTVRDLLGIDLNVERDLPEDASSQGFDNQGDVLFVTPESAEILARATDRALGAVIPDQGAMARLGLDGEQPGLRRLMERAFRRPPTVAELSARLELWEEGGAHAAISSVLLSPNFLFRVEEDRAGDGAWAVSSWELATRLSYFLWASMPDEALFERARDGSLLERNVLLSEVERMLEDPRAIALGERFAARWLGVAQVGTRAVDVRRFKGVNGALKRAMLEETVLFFDGLVRDGASLLQLVDARHTYLNAALAKHYGIEGVRGSVLRRVKLKDRRRGGVLTQASVLTVTSHPLRTSPVIRGAWVLDRLLGAPPGPPPPDAGSLPADDQLEDGLSMRQRLEQHRADARCAGCHARMDPIGFALENFDGVGRWRDEDHLGPVDVRATLPDGREVDGIEGLKDALLAKPERVARALTEALLIYALGRPLEPLDVPMVDGIVATLERDDWNLRTLVREVAACYPMGHRRSAR